MAEQTQTKVQRSVQGSVLSAKADKSITVLIERQVKHPLRGQPFQSVGPQWLALALKQAVRAETG